LVISIFRHFAVSPFRLFFIFRRFALSPKFL